MTFQNTASVALRYLRARGLRGVLTVLAIVFGVAMVYGANAMIPAIQSALEQATLARGQGALIFSPGTYSASPDFTPALLDAVRETEGVRGAVGGIEQWTLIPVTIDGVESSRPFGIFGVNPGDDYGPLTLLTDGRMPVEGAREAALDSDVANLTGVGIGGEIALFAGQPPFVVTGILLMAPELGDLVVPAADLTAALEIEPRIDLITVTLEPDTAIAPALDRLDRVLGMPQLRNSFFRNVQIQNTAFQVIFNIFGAIALFAGGFLISITFRTAVMERRRDLAVLRAIGAERGHVTRLLLFEALIQGALGSLIGVAVGQVFALLMIRLLWSVGYGQSGDTPNTVAFHPVAFLIAVAVGIGTGVVAGYFPARQAGRISPLDAMRPGAETPARRVSRVRIALGLVFALAGVLMLLARSNISGFAGGPTLLAALFLAPLLIAPLARVVSPLLDTFFPQVADFVRAGILRQPWRATATVNLMVVGFAIFTGIISILAPAQANNIERIYEQDAGTTFVLYGAMVVESDSGGIGTALVERVRGVENVTAAVPYREARATFNGSTIGVRGVDPASGTSMRSITVQPTPKTVQPVDENALVRGLAGGHGALISSDLAQAARVDVGDDITIQTPSGPRTYMVGAVVYDYFRSGERLGLTIDEAALAADFPDSTIESIYIGIADGARMAETQAALEAAAGNQIYVDNLTVNRERMIADAERGMSIFYILGLMILVPSALGLVNTLVMSVLERTREFGLIRAVGAERGHLRRMIIGEGLLLWLLGAGIGIFCGVVVGFGAMTAFRANSGSIDVYAVPFGALGIVLGGGLLTAVLAALLPARRAARLDILNALRAE